MSKKNAPLSPPTLQSQTEDERILAGETISFSIPDTTFLADDGGALTYRAEQPGGAALPSWLAFDAATGAFSGTAPAGSSVLGVEVVATSSDGGQSAEAFHIYTRPAAPILLHQAPDQRPGTGSAVSFALPSGSYADPSGGSLTYVAEQTGGAALPSWLTFDAAMGTFSGTAPSTPGTLGIEIVATSSNGGQSAEAFHVYTTSRPPTLQAQAPDRFLTEGASFGFSLPSNSFSAPLGSVLTYTSEQASMAALPSWISFDAQTGVFSGTAPSASSNPGTTPLAVRVDATEADGSQAAEAFHIYLAAPSVPSPPPVVLGSGPDKAAIFLTQTAPGGSSAQFEVLVDGSVVGGVQTADVARGSGAEQEVDVLGDFSAPDQSVSVRLLDAAPAPGAAAGLALSVDAISLDGVSTQVSGVLSTDDAITAMLSSPASVMQGSGDDSLVLQVSATPSGAASPLMLVEIDGVQVAQPVSVQANTALGSSERVVIDGNFGPGHHVVSVSEEGAGQTASNLTVDSATLDGVQVAGLSGTVGQGASALSGTADVTAPPAPPASTATPGAQGSIGLLPDVVTPDVPQGAQVLTVGAGKEYSTIAAAVAAGGAGAVVLVDAGTYTDDFVVTHASVSLYAVGGRVDMVADEPPPNDKGIITSEADLTVEGFDFSGASIPDSAGGNGAGIRVDGGKLSLVNDEFDHDENGILVNPGAGDVTIDRSLFDDNGSGSGYTHNVYIGDVAHATVTGSVFENEQAGNEFKSRAEANTITDDEFVTGVGIGTGSYDIDLPNGGVAVVSGNTLVKGPNAENYAMLHFGGEGIPYTGSSLSATGNVFEAQDTTNALSILNQTAITAQGSANRFVGIAGPLASGPVSLTQSTDGTGAVLPDVSSTGVLPSGALVFTDAASHSMTIQGENYTAVEGGAGHLSVDDQDGHVTVIGGTGGLTLTEGPNAGGSSLATAIGSTNMLSLDSAGDSIDSEGYDTIDALQGNDNGLARGVAVINAGTGNSTWTVDGEATFHTTTGSTVIGQSQGSTVDVDGTAQYFSDSDGGGLLSWNMTGPGNASSGSGLGSFSITDGLGSASIVTAGGSQGAVLELGGGAVQIQSHGRDLVYAGSGADTVVFDGSGGSVYAGSGQLSVFAHGGGGDAHVYAGGGDVVIDGDSGGIDYVGGAQANTVEARLSRIALAGGAGLMTVNGGADDQIAGGSGGLVFNDPDGGADTITTQAGSVNVVHTSNSDIASNGSDTLSEGGGEGSVSMTGNATLTLSDGSYGVSVAGDDTVDTTGGHHSISILAGASATVHTGTLDTVTDSGGTLDLAFADAGSGGALTTFKASGGGVASAATWSGAFQASTDGSAPETVSMSGNGSLSSGGADVITAGAGTETVTVSGSGQSIAAGSGSLTVDDWSGAADNTFSLTGSSGSVAVNYGGSGMDFIGGSGAATLSGGGTFNVTGGSGSIVETGSDIGTFKGGSGTASLSLNPNGGAHVDFGTGATTVGVASYGQGNLFAFAQGATGTDVVQGFRVGVDRAVLGGGVGVQASSVTGAGAEFTLSSGAHATFAGLTSTQGIFAQ